MKITIHAGENERTRIGKIVGTSMYVKAHGAELPDDFIIYSNDLNGTIHGVRPVQDYQEARDLVQRINTKRDKE